MTHLKNEIFITNLNTLTCLKLKKGKYKFIRNKEDHL